MPTETALVPVTPMRLIEMASERGASIEQMQQLFDLKLRVDADDARRAFNEAFSDFKAETISIVKNVTVKDGPLKGKKYVDLFGVVVAITPVLSKHGLSHSWKLTKDEKDWMEITCTIRHLLGHSESVSMGSGPDTGPGRNAIQARGSAKSYLERYTLLAAIGMAASDQDDDGRGTGGSQGEAMGDEQFISLMDNINAAENKGELSKFFAAAHEAAVTKGDMDALKKFIEAKEKRKAEL